MDSYEEAIKRKSMGLNNTDLHTEKYPLQQTESQVLYVYLHIKAFTEKHNHTQ